MRSMRYSLEDIPMNINATARGIDWNKLSKTTFSKPAKNPYATARGFTTSKKTTAKRKPTKKQLAALAKGRKILAQKRKKNK